MAHPEGGRDPKDWPAHFDGGVGTSLAVTGFTAEASLSEATSARVELEVGADRPRVFFALSLPCSSKARRHMREPTLGLGLTRQYGSIIRTLYRPADD